MIELEAYINDALCGVLSYDSSTQRWAFTYDSQWVVRKDAFPLGPTLPLTLAEDRSPKEQRQAFRIFFENLLPEGRALDDAAATYCAFRCMTDTIPDRWRTPFRRHGGQSSGGMADTLAGAAERCPP